MIELNCTFSAPKAKKAFTVTYTSVKKFEVLVGGENENDMRDAIEEAFRDGHFDEHISGERVTGKYELAETQDFDENGVLSHEYTITLANGDTQTVNVGWEEYWGNIQECTPDDCDDWETSVGWGNDEEGHIKIVDVVDEETGEHIEPLKWAKERVWCYVDYYSC